MITKLKVFLVFGIGLALSGIMLFFMLTGQNEVSIPAPDKLIIYKGGQVIEIKQNNPLFSKIIQKNNARLTNNGLTETAVEEIEILIIKRNTAIEYIYFEEQFLTISASKDVERNFTKLLFPLEGYLADSLIFYFDEDYHSGTLYLRKPAKILSLIKSEL